MEFYEQIIGALSPIIKVYHRPDCHGLENLPPAGQGFILAPNHTNWFGWDAMVISSVIRDRAIRWLSWSYEDSMPWWDFQVKLVNGILHNNNHEFPYAELSAAIKNDGAVVGMFPEGNNNTVKNWYRVQKFFPGCVRLAVMSGCPILPVSVAGLEEASPIFWKKEEENAPPALLIAVPFLFPTKVSVRIGEPIYPALAETELNDKSSLMRETEIIRDEVFKLLKQDRPSARKQL